MGNGVVTLWEGTNDIAFFKGTGLAQLTMQNVAGAITSLKASGCKVFVAGTISRTGNDGNGTLLETTRAAYNTLLHSSAKALGADGLIGVEAHPYLGATYSNNAGNTGTCAANTYFQSDCVHPTTAAQPFIATVFNNALNYYLGGSTLASPSIYTASATLKSSDRVVDASGCASTCAFMLPDGIGPIGEEYTILTGASTTTVQGQTLYGQTQTVNGSERRRHPPRKHPVRCSRSSPCRRLQLASSGSCKPVAFPSAS